MSKRGAEIPSCKLAQGVCSSTSNGRLGIKKVITFKSALLGWLWQYATERDSLRRRD